MVPLSKLRGITIPEEFKHVYKHYLEQEVQQIEVAYQQLINTLDTCHINKRTEKINQQIKASISLENFKEKVYRYFLRILYVLLEENYENPISIKTCFHDAGDYAIAEYLSVSIVKSI